MKASMRISFLNSMSMYVHVWIVDSFVTELVLPIKLMSTPIGTRQRPVSKNQRSITAHTTIVRGMVAV